MNSSILIISPFFSPNIGGVETHLDDLCSVLKEKDIKTYVITYQPLTTKAKGKSLEQRGSVKIMRINWYGLGLFHKLEKYPVLEFIYLFPGIFLKSLWFMFRHRQEIATIHSQGLIASCVAKILKRIFKKRTVASTHAVYNFTSRALLAKIAKYIFCSFNEILTLSRQSKRELVQIGLDEQKVKVYRYWVNQEIFKPMNKEDCKSQLGWKDKFVVLFVGRLLEIKGVKLLIKLSLKLKDNVYIAIAGDGPLAQEILSEAEHNKRIICLGKLKNDELRVYYNASDALVVPSLYEEGYGRVVLEALSCGLPVIASARGGMNEALSEEVGILINPTTVETMLSAIDKIHQNLDKETTFIREYALERFNKNNADTIIESYAIK